MSECNTVQEAIDIIDDNEHWMDSAAIQDMQKVKVVMRKLEDQLSAERTAREQAEARMKRMEDALREIAKEHDTWNNVPVPTVAACMARKALEVLP